MRPAMIDPAAPPGTGELPQMKSTAPTQGGTAARPVNGVDLVYDRHDSKIPTNPSHAADSLYKRHRGNAAIDKEAN